MRFTRLAVALSCLIAAAPVAAQVQSADPDIVVRGVAEADLSAWKRAESDHIIVTGDGGEAILVCVTNNLERLYRLMGRLYRKGDTRDENAKLQVTLLDSRGFFDEMALANAQWDEGPFAATFSHQRYYDPREDGGVIAVARKDQMIQLDTPRAANLDCDEISAEGGDCKKLPIRFPAVRKWEALLYSAFAQHFLLTYTQRVYPRWYLDGVGALFSTLEVRGDGAIDYARPPVAHDQIFRSYGAIDVEEVLTGRYLERDPSKATPRFEWTPHHGWLLAHFFTFSRLAPERARQFRAYMTAIHEGAPMAEAARVFGDMGALQREVTVYARKAISYARTAKAQDFGGDPVVTTLTRASAATITARIEMGSRLAGDAKARDAWLAGLRSRIAALPYDREALLVLAEAECRSGQQLNCLTTAERVLARAPDEPRALTWKGVALTDRAIRGRAAYRETDLDAARITLERAIRIGGQAPMPLIAYFRSYTRAGERAPEAALLGMVKAVQAVPAARGPRLELGAELARQGNMTLARGILYPLTHAAEDLPERRAARDIVGG